MQSLVASLTINTLRVINLLLAAVTTFAISFAATGLATGLLSIFVVVPVLDEPWFQWTLVGLVAFGPALVGVFIFPVGDWFLDHQIGARKPSERENAVLELTRKNLLKHAKRNKIWIPPIVFRIEDDTETNACAYGSNRVAFTTGMLREYEKFPNNIDLLTAIAAHELGHHRNKDCLINSLHNFLILPYNYSGAFLQYTLVKIPFVGVIFSLIGIVFVLPQMMREFFDNITHTWVEYRADRFGARLLGPSCFAEILDNFAKSETWKGGGVLVSMQRSHPPSELRRDRILKEFGHLVSSDSLDAQAVE